METPIEEMIRTQAELDARGVHIKTAADIQSLPWVGNHASDYHLFEACDNFMATTPDREEAKAAVYAMGKFGMGIDEPVDEAELDDWALMMVDDGKPLPTWYRGGK